MIKSIILISIILIGVSCIANKKKEVSFIPEQFPFECGPRCLQMIFQYYNVNIEFNELIEQTNMTAEEGTSMLNLSETAEANNFKTIVVSLKYKNDNIDIPDLTNTPHPSIAHWQGNYFVVIEKVTQTHVNIIHPRNGKVKLARSEFIQNWANPEDGQGIILLLEKNKVN